MIKLFILLSKWLIILILFLIFVLLMIVVNGCSGFDNVFESILSFFFIKKFVIVGICCVIFFVEVCVW